MSLTPVRAVRRWVVPSVLVAVAVLAAGCGGGSSSPAASGASAAPTNGAATARSAPGTRGEIVDISGATLQVQNSSGQVAVTYSSSTTFRQTVPATAADVTVGSCVSATAGGATGSGSAPDSSAAGTTAPVAATRVTISTPVNGSCTGGALGGGFGGGAGRRAGRMGNGTPPGAPGAPGAGGRGFGGLGVFGKVTAVSAGGFTVQSSARSGSGAAAAPAPTTRMVTTNGQTTYSKTVAASKAALKVGECLTAQGKADDTGTVVATAISLQPKEANGCSSGFGGARGGSGAGGQGAAGNAG